MSTKPKPSRATVLIVAAKMGCDARLAEKVIEHGPKAARNRVHRERAAEVLGELGLLASNAGGPRAA